MKTRTTVILFIFFLVSTSCLQAQSVTNIIPCNDYKAITFNGKTISQINATNADLQNMQQLFGSHTSVTEIDAVRSRDFHYGSNSVGFTRDGATYVSGITITDNQWPVVIQGKTVRVGDSVSSLQQAFGANLIIAQSQYVSYSFVSFGCTGYDERIHVRIDPQTNKVIKIVYFVSP